MAKNTLKIQINPNLKLIEQFLAKAGNSLTTFRYYQKRPTTISQKHQITLIGIQNNKPIAYGHLKWNDKKLWLGICTSQKHQGKGYGTIIMKKLINHAKNHADFIYLTTDENNHSAQKLYKKHGFKKITRRKNITYFRLELNEPSRQE